MTEQEVQWYVEERPDDGDGRGVQYWLTDGRESFRMIHKFIAEMLAHYLNKKADRDD